MGEIYISNLAFQGLNCGLMRAFPAQYGIEVFCETGNDYYWEHLLPILLEGRRLPLSLHGPFQRLDLSDPEGDFRAMRDAYLWAFELGRKHGAADCVCHPYGGRRRGGLTEEEIARLRETSLKRVLILNELAASYGIQLLVENLPEADGLFDQDSFLDTFAPQQELRFLIDTGHAHLQHWDIEQTFQRIGDRILGYHINDNRGDGDSHLMFGEGTIDWGRFLDAYRRYTPDANLVLEYNEGPLERIVESAESLKRRIIG